LHLQINATKLPPPLTPTQKFRRKNNATKMDSLELLPIRFKLEQAERNTLVLQGHAVKTEMFLAGKALTTATVQGHTCN
jgi:hypothetical protein